MEIYQTIRAIHLIAVVAWFAGLFYLPRLFVYHSQAQSSETHKTLLTMERKLYRYIMTPAMLITWICGLTMLFFAPEWSDMAWIHLKISLVILLTVYHFSLNYFHKAFAENNNQMSEKFFRIYNEVPTIILIIVVFLAVLKP